MSTLTRKPWTADERCRLPAGWRYEIDEGELVIMAPAGYRHDLIVGETARRLGNFVHEHTLGTVLPGELGIYLRRKPRETLRAALRPFKSITPKALAALAAQAATLAAEHDPSGRLWTVEPGRVRIHEDL